MSYLKKRIQTEATEKFLILTRKADEEMQKNKSLVDEKAALIRQLYILYKVYLILKVCFLILSENEQFRNNLVNSQQLQETLNEAILNCDLLRKSNADFEKYCLLNF